MTREDRGRAGCLATILLAIVAIAGGTAWLLGQVSGAGRDPWREADAALAVSLLAALGEEYHVRREAERFLTGWAAAAPAPGGPAPPSDPEDKLRKRREALAKRFQERLVRVRRAAGPRVLALAILATMPDGEVRRVLVDGELEGYTVPLAPLEGVPGGMQIGRGELKDGRPVLLVTRPLLDRWQGGVGTGQLAGPPWAAHVFLDPDAPSAPATAPKRDERGVLAAALLAALAEEYHWMVSAERVISGLARIEEHERAGEAVDPEERKATALDYVQRKQVLDQRFQSHLANARAAAGTRCLALFIESADPARPGRVLEAAGAGHFTANEHFAIERGGRPTGIGVGLGSLGGRPALETRATVRDAWSGQGQANWPVPPWTAHAWLNADPRQAPE